MLCVVDALLDESRQWGVCPVSISGACKVREKCKAKASIRKIRMLEKPKSALVKSNDNVC